MSSIIKDMIFLDFKQIGNVYYELIYSYIFSIFYRIFKVFDYLMTKYERKYFVYSKGSNTPYLIKYNILFNNTTNPYFNICLHHFIDNDGKGGYCDLHDHCCNYISLNLFGEYMEKEFIYDKNKNIIGITNNKVNNFFPFTKTVINKATHCHSISLVDDKPCLLFIVSFKETREPGFWIKNKSNNYLNNDNNYEWISFKEYYDNHIYCKKAILE